MRCFEGKIRGAGPCNAEIDGTTILSLQITR